MASEASMKPMIVIPPDTISADDIQQLRDNGICVVVSKEPAALRFMDPIPATVGRSRVDQAAIDLSRVLLAGNWPWPQGTPQRRDIAKVYVELLVKGTSLDPDLDYINREFDRAKLDEARKIAREEARAERAAAKAEKTKAAK